MSDNDFNAYTGTAEELRRDIAEHERSLREPVPAALTKEQDARAAYAMRPDVKAVDAATRDALIASIQRALNS